MRTLDAERREDADLRRSLLLERSGESTSRGILILRAL